MTMEVLRTPSGQMPTYVAAPSDAGPWPGVVVLHDFGGMSHDLRNQADWLAGAGFLAAPPDLYYWGTEFGVDRDVKVYPGARARVPQQPRPRGRDTAADLPGEDLRHPLPRAVRPGRTPAHRGLDDL